MLTRIIHLYIQPDHVADFLSASQTTLRHSRAEEGVLRFELFQQTDTPAHFVAVETYISEESRAAHLQSAHFLRWKETILPLLAQPLVSHPYQTISDEME